MRWGILAALLAVILICGAAVISYNAGFDDGSHVPTTGSGLCLPNVDCLHNDLKVNSDG